MKRELKKLKWYLIIFYVIYKFMFFGFICIVNEIILSCVLLNVFI